MSSLKVIRSQEVFSESCVWIFFIVHACCMTGNCHVFEFLALHRHALKCKNFEAISYAVFSSFFPVFEPSWWMCNSPRSMMYHASFLSQLLRLNHSFDVCLTSSWIRCLPYLIVNQTSALLHRESDVCLTSSWIRCLPYFIVNQISAFLHRESDVCLT